jgi:hypothetical protein
MVRRQPARAACFLAIGAGALSIVALLLPWYEYGAAREGLPSVSAFEVFSRGDIYLTAVAVAAIAAAVLNLLAPRKWFPLVLALLGGLLLGLPLFLRLEVGFTSEDFDFAGVGMYLHLIAGVAMCAAAALAFTALDRSS